MVHLALLAIDAILSSSSDLRCTGRAPESLIVSQPNENHSADLDACLPTSAPASAPDVVQILSTVGCDCDLRMPSLGIQCVACADRLTNL
jgi:hypothetical protein